MEKFGRSHNCSHNILLRSHQCLPSSLAGQISPEVAEQLLEDAFNLEIILYGDRNLHRRAMALAKSLNLPAAYDAHYLALSERFNAEFYTSDKRLFNSVKDTITWIHLVR